MRYFTFASTTFQHLRLDYRRTNTCVCHKNKDGAYVFGNSMSFEDDKLHFGESGKYNGELCCLSPRNLENTNMELQSYLRRNSRL